jgi:hypothetical protein
LMLEKKKKRTLAKKENVNCICASTGVYDCKKHVQTWHWS